MDDEKIVSVAALWRDDPPVIVSIPAPYRHDDIRMAFSQVKTNMKMGFLTSSGRFVDRREAAKIAYDAEQISEETDSLISENLW